jgi:hypothetical protein
MGIEKVAIIDSAKDIALDICNDQFCWVDDDDDYLTEKINPVVSIADISNEDLWVKDD